MSAVVTELAAAAALMLAFGVGTEDAMLVDVWNDIGFCTGRQCLMIEGTAECQEQIERRRPCSKTVRLNLYGNSKSQVNHSWEQMHGNKPVCEDIPSYHLCVPWQKLFYELRSPKWVPADQPTERRDRDGLWLKLQL